MSSCFFLHIYRTSVEGESKVKPYRYYIGRLPHFFKEVSGIPSCPRLGLEIQNLPNQEAL